MNKLTSGRGLIYLLCLVLSLPIFCPAQIAQQQAVIEDLIKENIKLAPCKNSERLEAVKNLFKAAGAQEAEVISDVRGSAPYKRELIRVHVGRAVRQALAQNGATH